MIFLPDVSDIRHMTSKVKVFYLQAIQQLFQTLLPRPGAVQVHLQSTLPPLRGVPALETKHPVPWPQAPTGPSDAGFRARVLHCCSSREQPRCHWEIEYT